MGDILTENERTQIINGENQRRLPTKDGLVGYWPLSAKSANGTDIYDVTGVNNGVSVNTPIYTTDPAGVANEAMTLNGTTDEVTITSQSISASFSILFWFKSAGNPTVRLVWEGQAASQPGFEGTDAGWTFIMNNADRVSTAALASGDWHHVACLYNSATQIQEMYLDSVSQGTNSSVTADSITTLYIASRGGVFGFFNGDMAKFRVYNEIKTQSEIDIIYNYELTLMPQ